MKTLITIVASFVFMPIFGQYKPEPKADSTHSVSIEMDKNMYIIGEPIIAKITYRNNNTAKDWLVARPDSNADCTIWYCHTLSKWIQKASAFNGGWSTGVIPDDDSEDFPRVMNNAVDTLCLKPNEEYVFSVNIIWKVGMSSLMPGKIYFRFMDNSQAIDIRTDSVCMAFTNASIPLLVSFIQDPRCKWPSIDWASNIFRIIHKGFEYKYTVYKTDKIEYFYPKEKYEDAYYVRNGDYNKYNLVYYTPAQKEKNDQNIQAFMQYWEQNKDTPEVINLIKDINWNPVKYRIGYMDDYCKWRNSDCN
jgi:hypothetical protein